GERDALPLAGAAPGAGDENQGGGHARVSLTQAGRGRRNAINWGVRCGLDVLLLDQQRLRRLGGRRVALLGHPAGMTGVELGFRHGLDALVAALGADVTAAFGPQHGMRGATQDNTAQSPTHTDAAHGIPVFSLYGDVRRPTDQMLSTF